MTVGSWPSPAPRVRPPCPQHAPGQSEQPAAQLHLPCQLLPDGQQGAGSVGRTGQQLLKAGPFFLAERIKVRDQRAPHPGWGYRSIQHPRLTWAELPHALVPQGRLDPGVDRTGRGQHREGHWQQLDVGQGVSDRAARPVKLPKLLGVRPGREPEALWGLSRASGRSGEPALGLPHGPSDPGATVPTRGGSRPPP